MDRTTKLSIGIGAVLLVTLIVANVLISTINAPVRRPAASVAPRTVAVQSGSDLDTTIGFYDDGMSLVNLTSATWTSVIVTISPTGGEHYSRSIPVVGGYQRMILVLTDLVSDGGKHLDPAHIGGATIVASATIAGVRHHYSATIR